MHLRDSHKANEGKHVEASEESKDPLENAGKSPVFGVHEANKSEARYHLQEDDEGAECAAVG